MFFRVMFPSWQLFDRLGSVPRLYARWQEANDLGSFGEWRPLLNPPRRRWWSFFLNPEGNLHHAIGNALLHCIHEPENSKMIEIARNLARRQLKNQFGLVEGARFQFKLTSLHISAGQPREEDVLISEEEIL